MRRKFLSRGMAARGAGAYVWCVTGLDKAGGAVG